MTYWIELAIALFLAAQVQPFASYAVFRQPLQIQPRAWGAAARGRSHRAHHRSGNRDLLPGLAADERVRHAGGRSPPVGAQLQHPALHVPLERRPGAHHRRRFRGGRRPDPLRDPIPPPGPHRLHLGRGRHHALALALFKADRRALHQGSGAPRTGAVVSPLRDLLPALRRRRGADPRNAPGLQRRFRGPCGGAAGPLVRGAAHGVYAGPLDPLGPLRLLDRAHQRPRRRGLGTLAPAAADRGHGIWPRLLRKRHRAPAWCNTPGAGAGRRRRRSPRDVLPRRGGARRLPVPRGLGKGLRRTRRGRPQRSNEKGALLCARRLVFLSPPSPRSRGGRRRAPSRPGPRSTPSAPSHPAAGRWRDFAGPPRPGTRLRRGWASGTGSPRSAGH